MAVESLLRISNTSPDWTPPSPISTFSGNSSPTTCTDERSEPVARDICSVTLRIKENSPTILNGSKEVLLAVSNDVRKPLNSHLLFTCVWCIVEPDFGQFVCNYII